jgi:uncharacterized protein
MQTEREQFWNNSSFAFVGHTTEKGFPRLSYDKCKQLGKQVFAVDPSVDHVNGDKAYRDFSALPEPVKAAVLEVPKSETAEWVKKAADAGIENVWIHMKRDTPEALAVARERGLHVLTGACAVMYVNRRPSYHSVHKLIAKLTGRY